MFYLVVEKETEEDLESKQTLYLSAIFLTPPELTLVDYDLGHFKQ